MNLQDKLNELRADNTAKLAIKERELEMSVKLFELTGLEFLVLIFLRKGEESTHAWIENNQFGTDKFDRTKIAEYYKQLSTLYVPALHTFTASSKVIQNIAPVKLTCHNNTGEGVFYHQTMGEIEFTFENDFRVSFKCPVFTAFDRSALIQSQVCLKPHNKTEEGKMCKAVYNLNGLPVIKFYGGSTVTYAATTVDTEIMMSLAMTGKHCIDA